MQIRSFWHWIRIPRHQVSGSQYRPSVRRYRNMFFVFYSAISQTAQNGLIFRPRTDLVSSHPHQHTWLCITTRMHTSVGGGKEGAEESATIVLHTTYLWTLSYQCALLHFHVFTYLLYRHHPSPATAATRDLVEHTTKNATKSPNISNSLGRHFLRPWLWSKKGKLTSSMFICRDWKFSDKYYLMLYIISTLCGIFISHRYWVTLNMKNFTVICRPLRKSWITSSVLIRFQWD